MAEVANIVVDRSVDMHLGSHFDCRCRSFALGIVVVVVAVLLCSKSRLHLGEPLWRILTDVMRPM